MHSILSFEASQLNPTVRNEGDKVTDAAIIEFIRKEINTKKKDHIILNGTGSQLEAISKHSRIGR